MAEKSDHEGIRRAIGFLLFAWGIIFVPVVVMIAFILTGHGSFQYHDELTAGVLYYNLLLMPIVILGASIWSYVLLKKKKYVDALFVALIPFINVFVEVLVVDIVLWFV